MLVRASLLLAAAALTFSTAACSSLTRPNEIQIWAEPPPAPTPAAMPAPAARGAAAAAPGQGG